MHGTSTALTRLPDRDAQNRLGWQAAVTLVTTHFELGTQYPHGNNLPLVGHRPTFASLNIAIRTRSAGFFLPATAEDGNMFLPSKRVGYSATR